MRSHNEPVPVTDGPGVPGHAGAAALALERVTLRLSRAEPARARRCELRDSGRQDRGAGRHLRRRQDDDGAAADALLGSGRRPHHAERRRSAAIQARRSAPPHRAGGAGHLSVQRHAPQQHPDRAPGGERGGAAGGDRARLAERPGRRPCPTAWTRRSASAAPACPAASASASPSRAPSSRTRRC